MGVVVGAHGVRGLVRLKSFAEEDEALGSYGALTDEAGKDLGLQIVGKAKGVLLGKLDGVSDRDAAQALKGTRLYLDRSVLPPAEEDEFYHSDLIGLRVDHVDGWRIGEVVAVHDFGAGDLLDVRLEGSRKTVLIPFDKDTVPEVDLEAGKLVIDPMDGLLEEETEPAEPAK